MGARTVCAARGGGESGWIQVGLWGRDRFHLQASLGLYREDSLSAVSALLSSEEEGTSVRRGTLSTHFLLHTRCCVYHFLISPGGQMRK